MRSSFPASAESSLLASPFDDARGDLQSPPTASEAGTRLIRRVLRVKIERPDAETWRMLRDVAAMVNRYRDAFFLSLFAKAHGAVIGDDPAGLEKKARAEAKEELSGAVYAAAESEAKAAWQRDGHSLVKGWGRPPRWEQSQSIPVRGHRTDRSSSGVWLLRDGDRYRLSVSLRGAVFGQRYALTVSKGVQNDEWQAPLLAAMVSWTIPITKAVLVFRPKRGDLVAHLSYETIIPLPPMGSRVATLGPIEHERDKLTLRTECDTIDYSSFLHDLRTKKDHYDGIARRLRYTIGRSKGSSRQLRRKFVEAGSYSEWARQRCHEWSRRIIDWCQQAGVGQITVLRIHDGDWPAYAFVDMLTYKGSAVGITVVDESASRLTDASTFRAESAAVRREQRTAKKVKDAARTLSAHLIHKKG